MSFVTMAHTGRLIWLVMAVSVHRMARAANQAPEGMSRQGVDFLSHPLPENPLILDATSWDTRDLSNPSLPYGAGPKPA